MCATARLAGWLTQRMRTHAPPSWLKNRFTFSGTFSSIARFVFVCIESIDRMWEIFKSSIEQVLL